MTSPILQSRPAFVSRPRIVDYFLLLCGIAISLVLGEWSGLKTIAPESADKLIQGVARVHPYLFFLPLGILLLWPIFYLTQVIVGRRQGLSGGEWLWGFSWLADLAVIGWILWQALGGGAPQEVKRYMIMGYIIFVATAALIAVLILLVDFVGRWPQPWTHHFCLVLMIWSVLPIGLMWLLNLKLE